MATVTVKALHRIVNLGKITDVGDTLELEVEHAERLVEEGYAEAVGAAKRTLRKAADSEGD